MAVAKIDSNGRESMTAFLNTNGTTISRVYADPTTHAIKADDDTIGSDSGGNVNTLDDNFRPILFAESSNGSGTLVALYVTASGELLIDGS